MMAPHRNQVKLSYNRDLGKTLRKIAAEGRGTLYEGEIARAIVKFSEKYDGLLTEKDLADYHARWSEPIHTNYRGYEVYEMPPNSSGHILLQELNIVEQFDLKSMGCNTAESVHLMVEAKKTLVCRPREIYGRSRLGSMSPSKACYPKITLKIRRSASIPTERATDVPLRMVPNSLKTPPASVQRTAQVMLSVCCRAYNRDLVPVSSREILASCSITGMTVLAS